MSARASPRTVRRNESAAVPEGDWSLYIDESGKFEDSAVPGQGPESLGRVIGGVLCPHAAIHVETDWRAEMRGISKSLGVGYPWHATELLPEIRETLAHHAASLLDASGSTWLFVVDDRPGANEEVEFLTYVRMLGALVDLAGRVAASGGASSFEVVCAQRSVPIDPRRADEAHGLGVGATEGGTGVRMKPIAELEIRSALDSLRREGTGELGPWPQARPSTIQVATAPSVHPGIVLADLGSNRLRASLRLGDVVLLGDALIVSLSRLGAIRSLDRALRARPPALLAAAQVVSRFEQDTVAEFDDRRAPLKRGVARLARHLWTESLRRLDAADGKPIAVALAAHTQPDLVLKTGSYEGTWLALEAGWAGEGGLARRARSALTHEPELAGQLWRLSLECANHRGDVPTAEYCAAKFEELVRAAPSLPLLAERLRVRNLRNVALQNELPASPGRAEEVLGSLKVAATELGQDVALASRLVASAGLPAGPFPIRPLSSDETALWAAAVGDPPGSSRPDRDQGQAYGTAARSHAFAGDLDDALTTLMIARSLFESENDLRFNAAVIVRVEAERSRLCGGPPSLVLRPALALAGCLDVRPKNIAAEIGRRNELRFTLDALFRGLLWSRHPQLESPPWLTALRKSGEDSLFVALSALRSHPTELLARHAAELLRKGGDEEHAQRWFRLSTAVSAGAPVGAIRRLGNFTQRLAENSVFASEGPSGSVMNPTFEYR